MDFLCYFNLIEQQMYELQRFQQQIWQPWRDAHYLGKTFKQFHFDLIEFSVLNPALELSHTLYVHSDSIQSLPIKRIPEYSNFAGDRIVFPEF